MTSDHVVLMKAGAIVAEHGALAAECIIAQLGDVLADPVAVKDWRQVSRAVNEITGAKSQ